MNNNKLRAIIVSNMFNNKTKELVAQLPLRLNISDDQFRIPCTNQQEVEELSEAIINLLPDAEHKEVAHGPAYKRKNNCHCTKYNICLVLSQVERLLRVLTS